MEFLGIGPTEFLLILVIAILILGPKDLAKTSRAISKWLNGLVQSDAWKVMQEIRKLPTQLMREDNLEKALAETETGRRSGAPNETGLPPGAAAAETASGGELAVQPEVVLSGPPAEELKPEAGEQNA